MLGLAAEEKIRELDAQLALRNAELDDAFAQISSLTYDLRSKEEMDAQCIQSLEGSSMALSKEKENYQFLLDEKSLLVCHLEGEVKNLEMSVSNLDAKLVNVVLELEVLTKEKKSTEEKMALDLIRLDQACNEKAIAIDSAQEAKRNMEETMCMIERLVDERNTAVSQLKSSLNNVQNMPIILETVKTSIFDLNATLIKKFSSINDWSNKLGANFGIFERQMLEMATLLSSCTDKNKKLSEKIKELENSDNLLKNDGDAIDSGSLKSLMKSQEDTIKGFELALVEAQKYMDEKEKLAEARFKELSHLQDLYTNVRPFIY